jgi:hypothetical protein
MPSPFPYLNQLTKLATVGFMGSLSGLWETLIYIIKGKRLVFVAIGVQVVQFWMQLQAA